MAGKGSRRRKETTPGAYACGYDKINWSKAKKNARADSKKNQDQKRGNP